MASLQEYYGVCEGEPTEVSYWVGVPSAAYDKAVASLLSRETATIQVKGKPYRAFCVEFTPEWPGNRARVVWVITDAEPVA
jgi:hypothetical protein